MPAGAAPLGIFTVSGDASTVVCQHGRRPANLIHDESDDVLALFPVKEGVNAPVRGAEACQSAKKVYGEIGRMAGASHGDAGDTARFFFHAKASKAERFKHTRQRGCHVAAVRDDGDALKGDQ